MKNLVIIFTILNIALSVISSVVGILNNRILYFERLITESGEQVEILSKGICKCSVKSWVRSVMAWAIVRLVIDIPLLKLSFIFYLKGSLKSNFDFIGILFSTVC